MSVYEGQSGRAADIVGEASLTLKIGRSLNKRAQGQCRPLPRASGS